MLFACTTYCSIKETNILNICKNVDAPIIKKLFFTT